MMMIMIFFSDHSLVTTITNEFSHLSYNLAESHSLISWCFYGWEPTFSKLSEYKLIFEYGYVSVLRVYGLSVFKRVNVSHLN